MDARNISQVFVHLAGQRQAFRARMSEEGSPRCYSTRGPVQHSRRHSGLGVRPPGLWSCPATNSLSDNELGPLLSGASVYLYVK